MSFQPSPQRYDAMPYNRCGRSGLKLPAISLGLWHNFGGVDDYATARAMAHRAFHTAATTSLPSRTPSACWRRRRRSAPGSEEPESPVPATDRGAGGRLLVVVGEERHSGSRSSP
jgi:hypothetical protein